jgi:hypothetical protein
MDIQRRIRKRLGHPASRRDNVPDAPGSILETLEGKHAALAQDKE